MDVSSLQTEGYVKVGYPDSLRASVSGAMQSWQDFCILPEEVKTKFSVADKDFDMGYMPGAVDSKELFHVSKVEVPEFLRVAEESAHEQGMGFIKAVDGLINEIVPLIGDFVTSVEEEYQLPGFADEVMRFQDQWVFRYLHYYGGSTMLAKAHPDRGGFTLHLDESDPGGEYLNQQKVWEPWPVSHDETIIFPGMVLQHRSKSALKALWHRVQPTEVTSENGRFAMVAFIEIDHTHRYSDASGKLSEFPAGFNLTMPADEFAAMFEEV